MFIAMRRIRASINSLPAVAERVGFERDPSFCAIGVTVETEDVDIDMIALLREPRTRRPDFQLAVMEWNGFAAGAVRIDALRAGKENQLVRKRRAKDHHEKSCE